MLYPLLSRLRNRLRAGRLRRVASRAGTAAALRVDNAFAPDACVLCGLVAAQNVLGAVPRTSIDPADGTPWRLIHCPACDCVYLDPAPSAATLSTLYQGANQFDAMYQPGSAATRRIARMYARRLAYLDLIPESGAILEIGAGLAWISGACKDARPQLRTVAQDISAECAARCPWVDEYVVGPLERVRADESFDLIGLTHVIEHVPDPGALLAQLPRYLRAGGRVYVTAPHRPPLWRPGDGIAPWIRYDYLHVPAHLSYLSRHWIAATAERSGLELVHWDASHDGCQVFEAVLARR